MELILYKACFLTLLHLLFNATSTFEIDLARPKQEWFYRFKYKYVHICLIKLSHYLSITTAI
jgi:hypothetical protein